jgi:very-short-patch-repair endonuclease
VGGENSHIGAGDPVPRERRERLVAARSMRGKLLDAARASRRAPTISEALLWEALRRRQLGVNFRRQQPIGPFIVDFYCPARRLIIEVDGKVHDGQKERDAERQALLEAAAYRVMHFTAVQVEQELSSVLKHILSITRSQDGKKCRPACPSTPEGEGTGEGDVPYNLITSRLPELSDSC